MNKKTGEFHYRCIPKLCRRCNSYVNSRWKRSATSYPPDMTTHAQEDFDVNLDDDDDVRNQEEIYVDVEDRRLYKSPGLTPEFDESDVFEEEHTGIS